MASAQTTKLLQALDVSGLSKTANSVYLLIRQLILSVDALSTDVFNVVNVVNQIKASAGEAVSNFSYSFTKYNIVLSWSFLGTGYVYEIREGTTWESASYLTSSVSTTAILDPRVSGTYHFLIKAIDTNGVYSTDASALIVTIPSMGSLTATSQTISNNVLLYWSEPSSVFAIDHYNISRGTTLLGSVSSTFFAFFEAVGGTYNYSIVGVDIVGNTSPSNYSTSVTVGNPADFILMSSYTDTTFAGTKTNAILGSTGLVAPVNTSQTWNQHFTSHSWTSPADQIAAGYPIFIQPGETSGSYQKIIDIGAVIHNTSAVISYETIPVVGTVSVGIEIEGSTDGVTYGTPTYGNTAFFTSVRYLRITFVFTPSSAGHDLVIFSSFTSNVSVQLEQDGGNVSAVSTDIGGTVVNFTKSFLDVISITVAALSTDPTYCVYDFTDVPNPTSFKVLVFDSSGTRVSKTVSWKARGIV